MQMSTQYKKIKINSFNDSVQNIDEKEISKWSLIELKDSVTYEFDFDHYQPQPSAGQVQGFYVLSGTVKDNCFEATNCYLPFRGIHINNKETKDNDSEKFNKNDPFTIHVAKSEIIMNGTLSEFETTGTVKISMKYKDEIVIIATSNFNYHMSSTN